MRQFLLRLFVVLAACGFALPAWAQQAVDTALVLAVDASGSIDGEEFAFQKEGIAAAVTDPRVLDAMRSGPHGRIALAYVEWGGPGMAQTVVSWHFVADAASAETFAAAVIAAPRSAQSYNAIGDAIDHGVELLQACPCKPTRRVIDISGDNADMRSFRPAPRARDAAVRQRITINALAVLAGSNHPDLVGYYESNVIGGQGAFVLPARDRRDFARALREKMILEVAWDRAARDAQAASAGD